MVRSILIVGGGSSGWMTAAYFASHVPDTRITLVESPDVPTVGVGESTNPFSIQFNRRLGLEERAFMRACDATYKISIRFDQFRRLGASFFHPFGPVWGEAHFEPNADHRFLSTHLSRQNKFDGSVTCRYGYQMDATRYGELLREYAIARGVTREVATIRHVNLGPSGEIASVDGRTADLYVDCTGFRALLLGEALKEPFLPLGDYLLNDRAVAMTIPYMDKEAELLTCTACTALSAGWAWNIPLWSRRGVGYVYSSLYTTEDEAERELREHVGALRTAGLPCRHIRIRHGRHRRAWVKNCIGIGLSAGFIEPLESTGITLTQLTIVDLVGLLDRPERYNQRVASLFDTTADFIQAHYILTEREDTPYWRHVKTGTPMRVGLASVLEGARRRDYSVVHDNPDTLYRPVNWNCILSGMGVFGEAAEPTARPFDIEHVRSHHSYLGEQRSEP